MVSQALKRSSRHLDRRIASYGFAAIGALAMTPAAGAQVIYTQTDLKLTHGALTFDIDANGTPDFYLVNRQTNSYYFVGGELFMRGNPLESNAVVGHEGNRVYEALPVPEGVTIGPNSPGSFLTASRLKAPFMAEAAYSYNVGKILNGRFANTTAQYLGFRFTGNRATHYGWMRLSVIADVTKFPSITVKVSGYAYEATPDTAIVVGDRGHSTAQSPQMQPSGLTLGQLSLGAAGRK